MSCSITSQSYADDWFCLSVFLFRIATASSSICLFVWGRNRGSLGSMVSQSIKSEAVKSRLLRQNLSNPRASLVLWAFPSPTYLFDTALPKLCGWTKWMTSLNLRAADAGLGFHFHSEFRGGSSTWSRRWRTKRWSWWWDLIQYGLWLSEGTVISLLLGKAPRLDSTARMGWSGLSGEVEEKGGETRYQKEGLKLSIRFANNVQYTDQIDTYDVDIIIW